MTDAYRTIVVDPPWPQRGGGPLAGRYRFADVGPLDARPSLPMPYPTMTLGELAALPVAALAAPAAHLYLWTTSRFLRPAFELVDAWEFRYSTTLVWAKTPIGGGLGGDAFGIATEFVLFARRGTLAAQRRQGRNWWSWRREYDGLGHPKHSAKPLGFYDVVAQVSPGPYLDMFARGPGRLGWDTWGDEAHMGTEILGAL
jgi:N6-adenosine-specific RNA methylase IME4